MHPLAANLYVMPARNDREVVLNLRAPKRLVNIRSKEERMTESKSWFGRTEKTSHGRVGRNVRLHGGTWPFFASIGEVKFVDLSG
jgi:hypothetical protein